MVFNSLTFFVFFAIVLSIHHARIPWTWKKINLILASYLFYAAWNPPFVVLLWISTLVDWTAANQIARQKRRSVKRLFLILSLAVNLGLLGFFKYGNFLLDNFILLLSVMEITFQPMRPDIILPVGISFYTFQSMSYTIDVYRGKMKPWDSPVDFTLYVTFFPQLVAGPIVRAATFLPQCVEPRKPAADQMAWGAFLLLLGLFQKVVLADTLLAPTADQVFSNIQQSGAIDAWAGALAFSNQIFFDFAGYSTCAIGAALCLGFALPDNFRFPYGAAGFSDFWKRWHISLSSWLRDYLYIPLGGNRKGVLRKQINLLLTMLIGGLWHGASWRFVFWGGLHGFFLMVESLLKRFFGDWTFNRTWWGRILIAILTYLGVVLAWVFFRAQSLEDAFSLIGRMFSYSGVSFLSIEDWQTVFIMTAVVNGFHMAMQKRSLESIVFSTPVIFRAGLMVVMMILLLLTPGDDRAFIYFQF